MQENEQSQSLEVSFDSKKERVKEESQNENTEDKIQNEDITSEENKRPPLQTQKIIFNEAEAEVEEDESPTYKDFFEKDQNGKKSSQKEIQDLEEKPEIGTKRWELLYEKAKQSKIAKEQLTKEYESQRKDPECTFKPILVASNANKILSSSKTLETDPNLPVHERTKMWKSNLDKKLSEFRDSRQYTDLEGCTFRPDTMKSQMNGYVPQTLTPFVSKGIDIHLRRQIVAKQSKEEKETILQNPLQKLPPHVYKKDGHITIPKGPEFNKGKKIEIHALKKPMAFPTPKFVEKTESSNNSSPTKQISPQKASQILVDPVHVKEVTFADAIQILHQELHKINIDSN